MTVRLADATTLRVGGPAARFIEAVTESELVAAVRATDESGEPLLVLGGGSNVVIPDAGFDGTVIRVATRGLEASVDACSGAWVTVAAGESWDDLVATAVANEWSGIEALAGIPGLTGATPIQNVGAYGQEVADTVARVRAYDRTAGDIVTLPAGDCRFAYRTSVFKAERSRYVVLSVEFQLPLGSMSAPVRYAELADRLGVSVGDRAPAAQVREAVLDLRRAKGMVLDPQNHDTWSVGSFFTNPIIDQEQAARLAGAPCWAQPGGLVKVSAAWLVEHSGFERGFTINGRAGLSSRHALAITNRGDATSEDVLQLARTIRDGVRDRYGVTLEPEPILVGASLD